MASSTLQAQCKECQNGVATCSGCRKQYCINHFQKHRQELAARMDEVGEEHDLLQQDLERENMMSELFSRIENWKQQSIKLIEDTAEQESLEKLTEKLKSSQLSNNYAEKQLDEWMRQLLQLRQMLEKPSTIDIVEDDTTRSSIHMIKVIDRSINEHDRMVRNMTTLSSSLPAASASSK
ncbi:unnamed protein product [Rotaria sp. Silwood2]|nr:unnamed protein product [Rotaria sp. Silwood2]CAF4096533.1 unnamed protein product [Rotaria sp. Silwood2]CAF4168248.1 unnamed protein product [Rotaria sp. Silwood2]CAF4332177.1 unnamed protein product [Rotaria sp. Silwood2]